MRADPVHLRVSRDSLGLADTFEVSRAESEALVETLNRHFGPTMLFYPMRPARWYVRFDKAPELQTTPRMRARTSFWNPFITESTTISAATPSAMPSIEVSEMKEMK